MSGFLFGQAPQPPTQQVAPFSLGASTTAATTTTGGSAFNFTIPSTTTAPGTTTGFTAVATVAPFGQTTTPTTSTLGTFALPTAAAATTTSSSLFGGFPSLTATTTTATTTAAPSLFSSLGTQPPASTSLGGPGFSFGATPAAPTTTSVGLGGVDFSNTTLLPGTSLSLTGAKSDAKAALKENPLPDEILVCLEQFKKHVKEQKEVREAISRYSRSSIERVSEEVTSLSQQLAGLTNGVHRHRLAIERLKDDAAKELKNAEIAQRTKDTPPALQLENTAPVEYFYGLIEGFQVQMKEYQVQISQLEQLLVSSNPAPLAPQELTILLRRLHETFVSIAARIHGIHEAVQGHKENLLNYQRSGPLNYAKLPSLGNPPTTIGPSPFTSAANSFAMGQQQTVGPIGGGGSSLYGSSFAPAAQMTSFGGGLSGPTIGSGLGLSQTSTTIPTLGSTTPLSATTPLGEQKTFQLKPPPSSKRNKRWTSS